MMIIALTFIIMMTKKMTMNKMTMNKMTMKKMTMNKMTMNKMTMNKMTIKNEKYFIIYIYIRIIATRVERIDSRKDYNRG